MKVAIVHDYLNQFGGAERVLREFFAIFPDADLYTLFYDKKFLRGEFAERITGTSFLDFNFARRNHRLFIPAMPIAAQTMAIANTYDLVISATAGYAKGIAIQSRKNGNGTRAPFHLSYCYTPLRYAWEIDSYFTNPIFKTLFRPAFTYLRKWDYRAAQKPDALVAISDFIAGKIRAYYGRDAAVVYPPVDYGKFYYEKKYAPLEKGVGYFLAAGRLLHYKKFDLLVQAFGELGLPLKIVGEGPEEGNIKYQISTSRNIELLPFVSDDTLRKLYSGAKAVLFPQAEDFGLVAAEAQACGAPVIAYDGGGAREIVRDGETGIFFQEQTPRSIIGAVNRFLAMRLNRLQISKKSRSFSRERFQRGIMGQIPPNILDQ